MIARHKVTIFYTAPTAIRSLIEASEADAKVHPKMLRSVDAAHPRHGRRTDQSGSVDVVSRERRARPVSYRRYVVADRDRRPHDHAAAGRGAARAGFVHAAVAGRHGGHRRRNRSGRAERAGRHSGRQTSVAVDAAQCLGRSEAISDELFPRGTRRQAVSCRRWHGARQTKKPATSRSWAASTTC